MYSEGADDGLAASSAFPAYFTGTHPAHNSTFHRSLGRLGTCEGVVVLCP